MKESRNKFLFLETPKISFEPSVAAVSGIEGKAEIAGNMIEFYLQQEFGESIKKLGASSYKFEKVDGALYCKIIHPRSTAAIRFSYVEEYFKHKKKYPNIYYDLVIVDC